MHACGCIDAGADMDLQGVVYVPARARVMSCEVNSATIHSHTDSTENDSRYGGTTAQNHQRIPKDVSSQ